MRREDYVFSIGYEGSAAVVDGKLRARYGGFSTMQLAEAGLFKQALCSAIHEGDNGALEKILSLYNRSTEHPVSSVEDLKRMYGAFAVPEGVTKVIVI
jgi:hypothetical protein